MQLDQFIERIQSFAKTEPCAKSIAAFHNQMIQEKENLDEFNALLNLNGGVNGLTSMVKNGKNINKLLQEQFTLGGNRTFEELKEKYKDLIVEHREHTLSVRFEYGPEIRYESCGKSGMFYNQNGAIGYVNNHDDADAIIKFLKEKLK